MMPKIPTTQGNLWPRLLTCYADFDLFYQKFENSVKKVNLNFV